MLHSIVQFGRQSTLEKAKEHEPEPKKRTMTVLKLTEGLGRSEAGGNVFEHTDLFVRVHIFNFFFFFFQV